MRRLIYVAISVLMLAACSPPPPTVNAITAPASTAAPTTGAAATKAPAATAPAATPFISPNSPTGKQPNREAVQLTVSSGSSLSAFYYSPPSLQAPAVLLLSPAGSDPQTWDAFARRLQTLGIASLAVAPPASDGTVAEKQAQAALNWLQARAELDRNRLGLVAAGGGAATALQVGKQTPNARALLLLSPDLGDQNADQALKTFGHPALVVGERDLLDGSVGAWLLRSLG